MNDATPEKLLRLKDVPKLQWLPALDNGKTVSVQSVYNWTTRGSKGIRLRCVGVGGTRCTTESWLFEFFEKLAMPKATDTTITPSQAKRSHERAGERLAAYGI